MSTKRALISLLNKWQKHEYTSFAKQSIANNPCKTGRPFPIDGVYDTATLARGLNAAGPVYRRDPKSDFEGMLMKLSVHDP